MSGIAEETSVSSVVMLTWVYHCGISVLVYAGVCG